MFVARLLGIFGVASLCVASMAVPANAEVRNIDPNTSATAAKSAGVAQAVTVSRPSIGDLNADLAPTESVAASDQTTIPAASTAVAPPANGATATQTYHKDDVIGAAEGVFGKGAKGLGTIVEKILKDQGEPDGYIAGREVSGAFVVGLRYGSGTLTHNVEGQRPVYWTGPSVGFDVGGDATKVFVLVYNLYDSQDLYKRFPQVEGRAYFVGGFSATYLRRGSVALIPVRLGVGLRLGANIGYMKFSEKSRWLPF